MAVFELAIGLLLVAALLSLWANRIGVAYPALLALGGGVLALTPGTPQVTLDPDLALALFVAPVLPVAMQQVRVIASGRSADLLKSGSAREAYEPWTCSIRACRSALH